MRHHSFARIGLVLIALSAFPPLLGVDVSGPAAILTAWSAPVVQQLATALGQLQLPEFGLDFLMQGMARSPIAAIGVAMALIVPLIALVAFLFHSVRAWRRRRAVAAARPTVEVAPNPHGRRAWIELKQGRKSSNLELSREVLHIGRSDDNDLRLTDPAIGAFHAIIRRTPEAEYFIMDVSGVEGTGIAVNGRRFASAPLHDGDKIKLGNSRMTFRRPGVPNEAHESTGPPAH